LHHPGDEFSYDSFTQAARTLAADRPLDSVDPLGGLQPRLLVATGESQSAMRLGSYINMADDPERLFDAFFLNLHWGVCPYPPNQTLFESFAPIGNGLSAGSSAIHDRGRAPILVLNTQSETLRCFPVRNAALEHLVTWADGGTPPPSFPPINVENRAIVTDEIGNATGGIRLPDLAAPTAVQPSSSNAISPIAALAGQSTPLTKEQLNALYPDADAYLKAWNDAVDLIRTQGLILESDLDAARARGRTIAAALRRC
jgi:hypothetical protein